METMQEKERGRVDRRLSTLFNKNIMIDMNGEMFLCAGNACVKGMTDFECEDS